LPDRAPGRSRRLPTGSERPAWCPASRCGCGRNPGRRSSRRPGGRVLARAWRRSWPGARVTAGIRATRRGRRPRRWRTCG